MKAARKILSMAAAVVVLSFATFMAFAILPGDAAQTKLGTEATPEQVYSSVTVAGSAAFCTETSELRAVSTVRFRICSARCFRTRFCWPVLHLSSF